MACALGKQRVQISAYMLRAVTLGTVVFALCAARRRRNVRHCTPYLSHTYRFRFAIQPEHVRSSELSPDVRYIIKLKASTWSIHLRTEAAGAY